MFQSNGGVQVSGPGLGHNVTVLLEQGSILSVDVKNFTARVRTKGRDLSEVPWLWSYANTSGGEGTGAIPEPGALCYVAIPSDRSHPFIVGYLGLFSGEEGFRAGRPAGNPGDWWSRTRDGNYIVVRRGGVVEISSTELCKTLYLPGQNTIRHFFENMEIQSVEGSVKWRARRDLRHASGKTPIHLEYKIREFAEDKPIIQLDVGRIPAEESTELYPAGEAGSVIVSLNLAETFTMKFDRNGSCEWVHKGKFTQRVNRDHLSSVGGQRSEITQGRRVQFVGGDSTTKIGGREDQTIDGGRKVTVRGDDELVVTGVYKRTYGQREIVSEADETLTVDGSHKLEVQGNDELAVAGSTSKVVGENASETVLGSRQETVGHVSDPTSLAQDGLADLLTVLDGLKRTITQAGSQEWIVGPEAHPFCRMKLHGDPTHPLRLGRITIDFFGGASVIFNGATGDMELRNGNGEIRLAAGGQVRAGKHLGGVGYVITTATHPVDYMTGAPIQGVSGLLGTGTPQIGPVPSIPPIPDKGT